MSSEAIAVAAKEERVTKRVPYYGAVQYTANKHHGAAKWSNISTNGACMELGRYLRPGRVVQIDTVASSFTGVVMWCKSVSGNDTYEAGLRMVNDNIESSFVVLSAVMRNLVTQGLKRK
jgi:hypothetical protein